MKTYPDQPNRKRSIAIRRRYLEDHQLDGLSSKYADCTQFGTTHGSSIAQSDGGICMQRPRALKVRS